MVSDVGVCSGDQPLGRQAHEIGSYHFKVTEDALMICPKTSNKSVEGEMR